MHHDLREIARERQGSTAAVAKSCWAQGSSEMEKKAKEASQPCQASVDMYLGRGVLEEPASEKEHSKLGRRDFAPYATLHLWEEFSLLACLLGGHCGIGLHGRCLVDATEQLPWGNCISFKNV